MQQTTLYEKIQASQYGKVTTFEVRAPTPYLAIDPRIWVRYVLKFSGNLSQYFYGFDDTAQVNELVGRTEESTLAFRQGWCVARGINQVIAKINDKTVVQHQPRDYLDGLSRLFITTQEAKTQCSGGAFDSDTMIHDEPDYMMAQSVNVDEAGVDQFRINFYSDLGYHGDGDGDYNIMIPGHGCQLFNRGFKSRRYKFFNEGLRNDTTLGVDETAIEDRVPSSDSSLFEVWEPLPFEPFALFPKYQEGKELSCINRLEVRMKFENNLWDHIMCGYYSDYQRTEEGSAFIPTISFSIAPEMCVRYIPRVIPPEKITSLNVHHSVSQIFEVDRSSEKRMIQGKNTFTFDIAPDTDKVYFFMKRRDITFETPTETFLGIEEIQIKTPNADHTLDVRQLFDNWNQVSHNHDLSFDDYRYTKSVACISVRELRLDQRLHMIVKWRNIWKVPTQYSRPAIDIDDGTIYYRAILIMDKKVGIHC